MTADELLAMGDIGRRELLERQLVHLCANGFEHGAVAMRIGSLLAEYVSRQKLNIVVAAETGFRIAKEPDTVRAPDAGFVAAARVRTLPRRG